MQYITYYQYIYAYIFGLLLECYKFIIININLFHCLFLRVISAVAQSFS